MRLLPTMLMSSVAMVISCQEMECFGDTGLSTNIVLLALPFVESKLKVSVKIHNGNMITLVCSPRAWWWVC